MQNQRGNKLTGEDTAGKPPQEPPSPHKLRCFQDILDIVVSLSDEEWRSLSSAGPSTVSTGKVTKLQFASLCTKIVTSVCKSAIQSYLPPLIGVVGMEAVLKAEEKLEKKAESASMSSSTNTAPSSDHSAKSSPVDPSDLICMIIEEFVNEVKTAMRRSICKVASNETSQWSKDWKTTCSRVTQEMMNILEAKIPHSQLVDTPDLRKAQETTELATDTVTSKVIMVVLDVLDGSTGGRADSKTTDLLIDAAERLNQMATSSNLEERLIVCHKPREELQTKAARAVSQILLISTGVLEKSSRSPKIPSSLDSETDLDSMLEAMAEAGFPTDLLQSHLDATSRDIVDTISGNMEMLSVTRPSSKKRKDLHDARSDAAKDTINHVFQGVNEKVKKFYSVFKQLVKTRDTQDKLNTEPSSRVSETSETPVTKISRSAESQSACLIDEVMSSDSVANLNQPEGDASTVSYERIQVDSDVLLESATQNYLCCTSRQTHSFTGSCSTSTTLTSSSSDFHAAAAVASDVLSDVVAGIVAGALDRLAESLHPTVITGDMQDFQPLLVNSEQTESQRNDDMMLVDFDSPVAPPTTSSWAGSVMMRETLENPKNPTNDYETQSSSSSPVNESCSTNPVTVAEKKSRRGFQFVVGDKAPLIGIALKKLNKVCPADTMSDSHQCASSSEDHPLSSQREPTLKPFKKTRRCLSRIFAAVRKALPNPFQCLSQPS